MSVSIELTSAQMSTKALASLLREWSELRQTKKEEELQTPEWKKLETAYIEHLTWRFRYAKRVFGQQLISNALITFVVLALVISGLVYSFIQLSYAINIGDLSSLETNVQVETAGRLSIGSSLVGAVTLFVSLVFFVLYLKYVFQIEHPEPPYVSLTEEDAKAFLKKNTAENGSSEEKSDVEVTSIKHG